MAENDRTGLAADMADMSDVGEGADVRYGPGAAGRTPTEVLRELDDEQREAVNELLAFQSWQRHPVDIRLTLPWLGGRRYYLTLIAGPEKRSDIRQRTDRARRPFLTGNNLAALMALLGGSFLLALLALILLWSLFPV